LFSATDKWGFTPLHEAAQKGRTQLCALLLAHGADPILKNQEGQMPIDLASAEDVKCLLQDAMPSNVVLPTTTKMPVVVSSGSSASSARMDGAAAVVSPIAPGTSRSADQVKLDFRHFRYHNQSMKNSKS
jgi:tankyrase